MATTPIIAASRVPERELEGQEIIGEEHLAYALDGAGTTSSRDDTAPPGEAFWSVPAKSSS